MNTRALALEWWRKLSPSIQKQLAEKHFPDKEFILITTSSMMIQRMFEVEGNLNV